ncbi:NAD(P)/FAD-dependent oxidoreductase [Sphingomonas immobilis]|uniref:NAD(P)/FAD-dependent oxidoreductase n=1 Tax=Sphingomonas immobilis TaxID=3063997 RepID=A0ABT8ZZS3_9SPHN|nr:NAD(P)/FAD-dependent oxidoreductase [Sphingomonas sp. CA1-15]MDO7842495.1 NAD(P)/FAD-dependent oxidoreductase [Sphingomonas sp. CA1-15]
MRGPVKPDLKTQIVIVGGGAAGLELATRLGRRFGRKRHDIILVERNRTHVWKPLLHEVATGALDANIDEVGYRAHCHRWGYRFFNGTLEGVDAAAREVLIAPLVDDTGREIIARHRIRYDHLVLAYGSVTNDFGTPGARDNCFFLDSRAQADRFRDHLINHCLRVSRAMQDGDTDARVRIAIVGGGATGVELAAELYNAADALSYYGLEVFDRRRLEVTLIEAGPRILPALPEAIALAAHRELEKLGVHVVTGTGVTEVTADAMLLADGARIPADIRLWAAGVKAMPIAGSLSDLETNRAGQLVVLPTLQTTRDPRIFAMGDCAACTLPGRERPVPPRAQAAHQMAATVFANLVRAMRDRPLVDFAYHDHGSLVSLSRYSTVGNLMGALVGGALAVEGRIARFVYLSLYRMHLVAIHGWVKGTALIVVGWINARVRPRLKLH